VGGLSHAGRRRPDSSFGGASVPSQIEAADGKAWRTWLRKHHRNTAEVWLVFYKKGTGIPGISYGESLEEAICFGWIDGKKKRLDEQRYIHRFTPRKKASRWSPRNMEIAEAMIAAGRMQPAGLAAYRRRIAYEDVFLAARAQPEPHLVPEIEEELRSHQQAWASFTRLTPAQRRQYVGWLNDAKKPETRTRRVREAKKLLAANRKLGMK
jgi:uncharacterized protein YdeI (YjbR/CyaY-like superfamily)